MDAVREFIFQTPRLTIRNFAAQDWRRLQAFGGRPEVARMMAYLKSPWPDEDVKAWILRARHRGTLGFIAGIYKSGADPIGFVGIGGDPVNCAYAIDPDHWGNGYATEAVQGLLQHCFDHLGLETVEADHFTDNPASGTVMRKLGFVKTGTGMGDSLGRPSPAPVVQYRLTREQFVGRADG